MPNLAFNFSSFRILIDEKSSERKLWRNSIDEAISIQLEGGSPSTENNKYTLILKDFHQLDYSKSHFIVPGNYYFKDDIFIDVSKKVAFRQTSANQLEFWCASTYGMSFPFLFQLLLVKNQCTFVHSGAFSFQEKGILLSAFGGIGKTALLAKLSSLDGYKLMGDDLNILSRDGSLQSYLRPFCLYQYHKPLFKKFYELHSIKYLKPALLWRIYNRLLHELKTRTGINLKVSRYITNSHSYVTASPFVMFDHKKLQMNAVPLNYAFVVSRHDSNEQVEVAEITKDEFADFSLNVLYHEWDYFDKTLKGYLTFQKTSLSAYLNDVRNTMLASCAHVEKVFKISIPIALNAQESTQRMLEEIKRIVND